MNKRLSPLGWTILGAGFMYVFDPGYGKRRRALVRDKAVQYLNELGDAAGMTIRDVTNRSYDLLARGLANRELRHLLGIGSSREATEQTKSGAAPHAIETSTPPTLH